MPENAKILEPLAKFHARILSQNRITIPKETREVHSISARDYVVVILRKLQGATPIQRVLVILRVSTQGVAPLPMELVRQLNLVKGEIVEVVLLKVIHPPKLLIQDISIPAEFLGEIYNKGFVFLDPSSERRIILQSSE